jgi:hypothetical protein
VAGTILWEKSLKIAATVGIDNFSALNGWISHFKQHYGLVFKKLAGESAAVDINAINLWFERLQSCWRTTRLGTSTMQMKWDSFSTACQTECWH